MNADDLTAIRGITSETARRLFELGITRFSQIAAWDHFKVQEIGQALGIGRNISRQNWIEQAALLAWSRGSTETLHQEVAAQSVIPLTPGLDTAQPSVMTGQIECAFSQTEKAPRATVADLLAVIPDSAPIVQTESVTIEDSLQYIFGIDTRISRCLKAGGIKYFGQIANWTAEDVNWWQGIFGSDARIAKDGWIAQAAVLSEGRLTRYAIDVISGKVDSQVMPEAVHAVDALPAHVPTNAAVAVVSDDPVCDQYVCETERASENSPSIATDVAPSQNPRLPNDLADLVVRADHFNRLHRITITSRQDSEEADSLPEEVPAVDGPGCDGHWKPLAQVNATADAEQLMRQSWQEPANSLRKRLDRARPRPRFDASNYAAYHGVPEEAAVEIVRREDAVADPKYDLEARKAPKDSTDGSETIPRSTGPVGRFLRALSGA